MHRVLCWSCAGRTIQTQHHAAQEASMKKTILGLVGAALMSLAGFAIGHSGGTDASGCHTNRKTGDYHCHNPKP